MHCLAICCLARSCSCCALIISLYLLLAPCVHLRSSYRNSNIWCKIFAWNSYNFSVKPSHFRNICSVFFCYSFVSLRFISSLCSIRFLLLLATLAHICTMHMQYIYNIYIFSEQFIWPKKISFLSNYDRNDDRQPKKSGEYNWNRNHVTVCEIQLFFFSFLYFIFFLLQFAQHIPVINFKSDI